MKGLFFELIQVALGNRKSLSRLPSANEWDELFEEAKKQSLVGVCFLALQRLGADPSTGSGQAQDLEELYARIGISEDAYFTWMGVTGKIQVQNELVNQQCVKLQKEFARMGYRTSVLKGQGVASLYKVSGSKFQVSDADGLKPIETAEGMKPFGTYDLSAFRQSGYIDLWIDAGMEESLKLARELCGECRFDYKNVHLPVFSDTETELHWRVDILMNLWLNRKLQRLWVDWREEITGSQVLLAGTQVPVVVPSVRLNRFYILLHCYRHFFEGGIGLRQVMDYYFVLQQPVPADDNLLELIDRFHIRKFASGLLWVMQYVFEGNPSYPSNPLNPSTLSSSLGLPADEREGRFILEQIISGGNFGHHDKRVKSIGHSHRTRYLTHILQRNAHLVLHYPQEVLWTPIWMLWHFVWKRTVGRTLG